MNNQLYNRIIEDLKKMNDSDLLSSVKALNKFDNVLYFHKREVDVGELMKFCVSLLLERRMRIPSGGYFNLISLKSSIKEK